MNPGAKEFADDVDATVASLNQMLADVRESEGEQQMSIGPDPTELITMARPGMRQWFLNNPDKGRQAIAYMHLATRDLIDEHFEKDPTEHV